MPATDPIAIFTQGAVRQVLWLLPLGLALSALKLLLVPMFRGRAGEARVGAVLDRIGADTLHDVILPDGRGGSTQVDHLVLTGAGILVPLLALAVQRIVGGVQVDPDLLRGRVVGLQEAVH
jgi:restriction system protein